jgi:hypothetical protein
MRPYGRTARRIDWSQELADHEKFLNQKVSFGPVNSAGKPSNEWRAFGFSEDFLA